MADHDEAMPSPASENERYEVYRSTLRTFEVVLRNGKVHHIFAHTWTNENPAGHLNFWTELPSGRQVIQDAFASSVWVSLKEITPADVSARIDRHVHQEFAKERGRQALANMKKVDRRVH